MEITITNTETYKKRIIESIWVGMHPYWRVDKNNELVFRSHKDAKAFISGMRPNFRIVNLNTMAS